MPQGDLFRPDPKTPGAKLRRDARDTSIAAAGRTWPQSGTARERVLAAIVVLPGTDEEIADALDMNPNTQRPRRKELEEMGWIRDSGQRRKTRSGTRAIVWEYVE